MESENLVLKLKLEFRETSKDSNSETVILEVTNKRILINMQYGGFMAPDNIVIEKKADKDKIEQIYEFVQEQKLNVNIEELKETRGIGIEGHLYFEIYQPDTTLIQISGKTKIWGTDDYVKKNWGEKYIESRTNLENINYFSKAESFVSFIMEL